ncbi:MAG: hypothetical protein ACYDGO_01765 [Smithellaceae bacterium]
MAGAKCIHCNCIGTLENHGIIFNRKTDDMPIPGCFKYRGHNPFSGNLHYECSRCETIILIDPMDVLGAVGAEIITDVREKQKEQSFFASLFFSQEEI